MRERVFLSSAAFFGVGLAIGRHIEVVASGLPYGRGVPVAVDATLVSPVHANSSTLPQAGVVAGVALRAAGRRKAATYPELVDSPVLCLATAAHETGGRANLTARKLPDSAATDPAEMLYKKTQVEAELARRGKHKTAKERCMAQSISIGVGSKSDWLYFSRPRGRKLKIPKKHTEWLGVCEGG